MQDAPGGSQPPPNPVAQAEALASLIRATLTPIVAPPVAELAASRQANERRAERIEALAREVGELRAETRALVALREAEGPEPTRRRRPPPFLRHLHTQWWPDWLILATLRVAAFALWLSR